MHTANNTHLCGRNWGMFSTEGRSQSRRLNGGHLSIQPPSVITIVGPIHYLGFLWALNILSAGTSKHFLSSGLQHLTSVGGMKYFPLIMESIIFL